MTGRRRRNERYDRGKLSKLCDLSLPDSRSRPVRPGVHTAVFREKVTSISPSVDEKTAVLRQYSKGEETGRERNKGREEARRNEMGRRGENMENL